MPYQWLAARVLADAYGQVTVIDRDKLPDAGTHRGGVPHGRHAHALLARGQQALEELFPGLTAELIAQGVPTGDLRSLRFPDINQTVRDAEPLDDPVPLPAWPAPLSGSLAWSRLPGRSCVRASPFA